MSSPLHSPRAPLLFLPVLVCIGLNMRPLLTSVGPMLPPLREASGMSFAISSLLTALPVMMMGLLALAGGGIVRYLSEHRGVTLGLGLIAVGALLRALAPQSAILLCSALLGGVGIGVIQVIMPGRVKRLFPRNMPAVMGLWSAALMGGGGLGAALTPWLSRHLSHGYQALAWWALPAVLALAGWLLLRQRGVPTAADPHSPGHDMPLYRHPRIWALGIYFGLINGGYTSLIAWLAPYYMQLGLSAQSGGSLLALMTLGQAAGALLMPIFARHEDRRSLLLVALLLQLIGFCGFIWLPLQAPVVWAVVCGFGLGGSFPLSLVLALDHSPHAPVAGRLVAGMQGIGFLLAGVSPYLSGFLRSVTGDYQTDWMLHAACIPLLMLLTLRFAPTRYPTAWRNG